MRNLTTTNYKERTNMGKPYYESSILITKNDAVIFSGLRKEFRDEYFMNCPNYKIQCLCNDKGWSLTIDEEELIK
jgi:hypothetical protein